MNASNERTPEKHGGFSLIELLVVLVLLSLLTAIAVPSMSGFVDRTKTRRALDRLVMDISYARVLSVQQSRRTNVAIEADGSYSISAMQDDGSWTTLRAVDLAAEYPGIAISGGLTDLQFTSRGTLDTAAAVDGFVKVSRGALRDSIFVSPAGRVYRAF